VAESNKTLWVRTARCYFGLFGEARDIREREDLTEFPARFWQAGG
jgi:hypothetical protein